MTVTAPGQNARHDTTPGQNAHHGTTPGQNAQLDRNERLLDAGAVLQPGTLPGAGRPDSAADVLTARAYAHPALDGRRIVRLVPGALGAAEDLAVDFLGLAPAAEPAEVGQVRQEALGFPAWALVHDPANGHHALALVKEIERLARQAKSKPGAAKDGFDALAGRLGRAVPHFLPTFCEEVGRIFLDLGNQTYAASWFGKAREAERTHGLAVDEERLRAVFLEFALAGALTVKSLRQYVKALAARLDPATAWQRFRQLCTERSTAGMAPYAGVAEDARALIRAAGLDRAEHEQALLAELLAAPAANRAPAAFWKSWHGALVELGKRDEAVRVRLLELMPDAGSGGDTGSHDDAWLGVLAETGAEQLLTGPRPEGAGDAEGTEPAAAWLRRWCHHHGRGWGSRPSHAATVALAGRMAGRLRADGVPVDLFTDIRRSNTLLDVLDLLLAEGVPVADPPRGHSFDLTDWVRHCTPASTGLAAVAADPRFRSALRAATPPAWAAAVEHQVSAVPLLRTLYGEWAEERADELTAARGLAGAADLVRSLSPYRTAVREIAPAAAERIAGLDIAGLLARALATGILDELGWPALEEALDKLADPPKPGADQAAHPDAAAPGRRTLNDLLVEDAWPHLILARHDKAIVVGPQGIVLEHTLRLPKLDKWNRPRLRFVDGELLVVWQQDGKQQAYWSGRPAEIFELGGQTIAWYYYGDRQPEAPSLPLPGGGRTTGERPLHTGDTRMPAEHRVLGDGTGHWTLRHGHDGPVLHEFDPATGTLGRAAEPPVIAATAAAGRLEPTRTRLLPLQPGLEHTPLGTDGTVLGSWVRVEPGRAVTTGTADGRTIVLPLHGGVTATFPVGRLTLPGATGQVVAGPVVTEHGVGALALTLPDLAAQADRTVDLRPCRPGELQAAGTGFVPPLDHWHALRVRDEAGSCILRAVTPEQAAVLIDVAWPTDTEPMPEDDQRWITVQGVRRRLAQRQGARRTLPVQAVGAVLPGIADLRLLAGVAGLARIAADLLDRVARFVPQPEAEARPKPGSTAAEYRPDHGRDDQVHAAVSPFVPEVARSGSAWGNSATWRVLNNLRTVTAVLADPPAPTGEGWSTPTTVSLHGGDTHHAWLYLLGRLHVLAHAAASPLTESAQRSTLVQLLDELTKGLLAGRGATLREIVLSEASDSPLRNGRPTTHRQGEVLRHGDRTVVILGYRYHHQDGTVHWLAVDHDPSGEFGPVAHFTTAEERGTEELISAAWVAKFWRVLALRGAVPHDPARAAAFGALTGIGTTRSALLLTPPPTLLQWYGTVLPADRLQEYGLKATEATAARDWLRRRDHAGLAAVWGALLPADPKTLWTDGPDIAAAAAAWNERFGRLVTLPEDAQATVRGADIQHIEAVLNPANTPWLGRTTAFRFTTDGSARQLLPADPSAVPDAGVLRGALDALRWLAYHLPADSPLCPVLPQAAAALRSRLADPDLLLDFNHVYTVKGKPLAPVLRAHFGLPAEGGADPDGLVRCGPALVLAPDNSGHERVWLRPAGLAGPDDPVLELLDGLGAGYWFSADRRAIAAVLGGELDRLTAPVALDAADGGPFWAQNPQFAVPDLVAEAARTHGLGEDAAALYLQLLALPDPTDRNVARWTGWKPARLKRARAELAATDLVLEAKRSRAGRTLFLPCGWQEAKSPALPAETWKSALYDLPTHQVALPHLPVPELFARAWQRILDGDAPGYEQLQTSKRRKARR
ncbi:hypothetical protein [Kitasatospora aureofaciens]|uniref:hypothetical protein n=1 Tax=Kitasatospora aureofaciens TaxID=1894 RepID=UPI00210E9FA4|nr:hypothetical protein [Kitasatospora aureofaciens]